LWDTRTWNARGQLSGHTGDVIGFAFTPDNAILASVTDAKDPCLVRLWDVAGVREAGVLGESSPGMWGVAITPDGKTLVCGGWDRAVHIWDMKTGKERLVIPDVAKQLLRALAISPDGRTIATGGWGPARLWKLDDGKEIPSAFPETNPSFFPGGNEVAGWSYGTGRVWICAVPSGLARTAWLAHSPNIEGLTISPDGRFVVSVGSDSTARIWSSLDHREVAILMGHKGRVYAASFSPDGKQLVTAGADDLSLRVWDLPEFCHVR
jgi:WD40 repeat protein